MGLKVYTGNRVTDGIVVFLADDGTWTESVEKSRVITEDDEAAAGEIAEDAARRAVVADPYLIDVTEEDGRIRPARFRERIRAFGPPVHPDFVKTAPTEADHFQPDGHPPAAGDGA